MLHKQFLEASYYYVLVTRKEEEGLVTSCTRTSSEIYSDGDRQHRHKYCTEHQIKKTHRSSCSKTDAMEMEIDNWGYESSQLQKTQEAV